MNFVVVFFSIMKVIHFGGFTLYFWKDSISQGVFVPEFYRFIASISRGISSMAKVPTEPTSVIICLLNATPLKTDMEPENTPLEKEKHLQTTNFWVPCLFYTKVKVDGTGPMYWFI